MKRGCMVEVPKQIGASADGRQGAGVDDVTYQRSEDMMAVGGFGRTSERDNEEN